MKKQWRIALTVAMPVVCVLALACGGVGLFVGVKLREARDFRESVEQRLREQNGITLAEFVARRPLDATRARVSCQLADHYAGTYGDRNNYVSLSLTDGGPTQAWAWAERGPGAGSSLLSLLKDGEAHWLLLELRYRGPDGAPPPPGEDGIYVWRVVSPE
jgi:hypothetical protein